MKINFEKISINDVINSKKCGVNNKFGKYQLAYILEISPSNYPQIIRILSKS
jgi:hypothetical protein